MKDATKNVERVTGTRDVEYDLVSVLYHALQGCETCEQYMQDAQRVDDQELARFFREVQEQNRRLATRAKDMLNKHVRAA